MTLTRTVYAGRVTVDPATIITNFQKYLKQRGQERLTIMVIPHGQEKIFSLQLNWLMIAFLTGILCLAVALSVYGIYQSAQTRQEIQNLRELYGINYNNTRAIEVQTDGIIKNSTTLFRNLEEIALLLGYKNKQISSLKDEDYFEELATEDLQKELRTRVDLGPNASYLSPVYDFKTTANTLNGNGLLIDSVGTNIKEGLGVYEVLPLGRPLRMNAKMNDSSYFGLRLNPLSRVGFEFHSGFDTSGPSGTPIMATGRARVDRVMRYDPGYGNAVVLYHGFGYYSLYAHMRRVLVEKDQIVNRGTVLGEMGRTGRVTGTHLHYEIWKQESNRINPLPYICALDLKTRACSRR